MPDRIIYLVGVLPKKASESSLEFVDDDMLGQLLSEGWEIGTTLPDRVVKAGGKSVKATMMVLKRAADNRGMVLRDEPMQERRAGGTMMTIHDEFGNQHHVEPARALAQVMTKMERALANLGDAGHLGGARNHSMPGLQIISGEMISKAWDVGFMAARRDEPVESNPFPPGSEVAQRWLRGYRAAGKALDQDLDSVAIKEAYQSGLTTAKEFGQEDEVTCPYPSGSPQRQHWLKGFRDGGGRVEK